MEKVILIFLVVALAAVSSQKVDTNPSLDIPAANANSTTSPPTTASKATTPITPEKINTSSTAKPNTTTTTTTTTTTVAPKPPNTTTGPKPTTPIPIGPRKSDNGTAATQGTWMVNGTDGKVCIIAKMAVKFVFMYNMTYNGNETKLEGIEYNLPHNETTVSNKSSCGNSTQKLVLEFSGWEFEILFAKLSGKYQINSTSLKFKVDNTSFPDVTNSNVTQGTSNSTKVVFTWNDGTSLKCQSDSTINEFSTTKMLMAEVKDVKMKSVELDVFRTKNTTDINTSLTYCEADTKVSNIVPIAVGAALAGLVLIVLIAYLIGRSRNNRGYESV